MSDDFKAAVIAGFMIVVLMLAFALGVSAFIGWLFSVCWNALLVPLAGMPALQWWHGWAAMFLLGCLGRVFRGDRSERLRK